MHLWTVYCPCCFGTSFPVPLFRVRSVLHLHPCCTGCAVPARAYELCWAQSAPDYLAGNPWRLIDLSAVSRPHLSVTSRPLESTTPRLSLDLIVSPLVVPSSAPAVFPPPSYQAAVAGKTAKAPARGKKVAAKARQPCSSFAFQNSDPDQVSPDFTGRESRFTHFHRTTAQDPRQARGSRRHQSLWSQTIASGTVGWLLDFFLKSWQCSLWTSSSTSLATLNGL